jgi:hypothetical protein
VFPYESAEWKDFFVATAGASAALAGLVFVAVSINIDRILKLPGLPDRALQTVLLLVGVLVMSIIGLVPGQSRTALGAELLGASLAFTAIIAVLFVRSRPGAGSPVSWVIGRGLLIGGATLPFVVGGASVLAGSGGGLYWIFAAIVIALAAAVANAWVLLVEILR